MEPQNLKELEEKIRAYINAHPDRLSGVKFSSLQHKEKSKDLETGVEVPATIVAKAHIEVGVMAAMSDLADPHFNLVADLLAENICKSFEKFILKVRSGS